MVVREKGSVFMKSRTDRGTRELELVRRALDQDEAAWSELVRRYHPPLLRLARRRLDSRLAGRIDPEDVVQETLTDVAGSLVEFLRDRDAVSFSTWLQQRLRTRIRRAHSSHLRTQARTVVRETASPAGVHPVPSSDWADLLADPGTSPSGRAGRAEDRRLIAQALGRLSEGDREVLTLFFLEGHDQAAIGARLGLTPNTVAQRLHRAVARMKSFLRRDHPEWCHAIQPRT